MLYLYKIINKIYLEVYNLLSFVYVWFIIKALSIKIEEKFTINGFPRVIVKPSSILTIGKYFSMNSGSLHNPIGRNQRCLLSLGPNAKLIIGDNVGVSSTAIICFKKIEIKNNVRIGGNTIIYDTNFHSLDAKERTSIPENRENIVTGNIVIGNNVFIGGHCIILKGVTIGDNSIIGAGSLVSRNIPPNEVWAGNPIKFLKKNEI